MKTVFTVFTIAFTLLLSGCQAHRATIAANVVNAELEREGSPYRWVVIDLEGDRARLEQQLAGEIGSSKVTESKKQKILSEIEQLEAENGWTTKPQLKEVRILPQALLRNKVVEAWVFDNSGKEIVYTVEPGTRDEEFSVIRWRVKDAPGMFHSVMHRELIGTPAKTVADEQLQRDILATIGKSEGDFGAKQSPTLLETRAMSQAPAEITEIWVVSRGEQWMAYTVTMKPSPKGGTDFSVTGPNRVTGGF